MIRTISSRATLSLFLVLSACAPQGNEPKSVAADRRTPMAGTGNVSCPCGGGPCAEANRPCGQGRGRMARGAAGPGGGACLGAGRGPGGGFGRGLARCDLGQGPLDEATRRAVESALDDERRAAAFYASVLDELGDVAPMNRIARAEERHGAALEAVLSAHGHPVPAARPTSMSVPVDRPASCKAGVTAEERNVTLYDRLLREKLPRDVACVFEHLRGASEERHLPALRACSG